MAQNHTSKGSFEPCMIVPAVTEVCLPQAAHSKVKGFPPCGQPLAPAHAGHRNPDGQRAAISHAAQASSSENWRWNSTSEAGKSGMTGPSSEPNVHVMFLAQTPALVTTHRRPGARGISLFEDIALASSLQSEDRQ